MAEYPRIAAHGVSHLLHKRIALSFAASILILFLGAPLLVYLLGTPDRHRSGCLNNLKALSQEVLLYVNDHDDTFPLSNKWSDAVSSNRGFPEMGLFDEPTLSPSSFGYAFNSALSQAKLSENDAAHFAMLFDSKNLAWNANDPLASLPDPPRHAGKNNFCYADGRAISLAVEQTLRN